MHVTIDIIIVNIFLYFEGSLHVSFTGNTMPTPSKANTQVPTKTM